MMKKKIFILLAVAVAGVLVLTACTSSEQGAVQSSGTQNTGSGTQTGTQSVAGVQTDSGNAPGTASGTSDGQSAGDSGDSQSVGSSGNVSGTVQDISGTSQEAPAQGGGPAEDGEPVGEVIPDEDAAAAENDPVDPASQDAAQEDEWSGTYISGEETVTIYQIDDETISFAFAQSGISGSAAVKGYQAVYNGDDHHVVVFNLDNDTVDVSVSSEEDYDASGSPLIGHYVKE